MADELIRLDTTIIGIDSLVNKASTAEEAKALFTVKDVIYSQQRYFTDVQPVKRGEWRKKFLSDTICCSECKATWSSSFKDMLNGFNYCPNCGADMRGDPE